MSISAITKDSIIYTCCRSASERWYGSALILLFFTTTMSHFCATLAFCPSSLPPLLSRCHYCLQNMTVQEATGVYYLGSAVFKYSRKLFKCMVFSMKYGIWLPLQLPCLLIIFPPQFCTLL